MKLVRDRIGDIPWHDGANKDHLGWVAPDSAEYRELLRVKLAEEVAELLAADRDAERIGDRSPAARRAVLEEAGDVYEVLRAILYASGTPAVLIDASIRDAADLKLSQRGGFYLGRTYDAGPALPNALEGEAIDG